MRQRLTFAINHMAAPKKSFAALLDLAQRLGLGQIEIRNDLEGVAISDGTVPSAIRAAAEANGIRILSINALQRFNDWSDQRAEDAQTLAAYARDCGAEALVLCPVNDPAFRPGENERLEGLRIALRALAPILGEQGVIGLIEPLGFEQCSLCRKTDALAAIDDLALNSHFRLVHDTFHHHLAGESQLFAERTGLVHISGVEDRTLPLNRIRDEHRILVGAGDILGNTQQIAALMRAGYTGPFSFEPFAPTVHELENLDDALRISIGFIEREVAKRGP